MQSLSRKFFYGLMAIFLILTLVQIAEYFRYKADQDALAESRGLDTTLILKSDVEALIAKIETEGRRLGELFGSEDLNKQEVEEIIREVALSIPEIRGVTACYEPFAFDSDTRLYCPYYTKDTQSYLYIEESYDYTKKGAGTAWYTSVVEGGETWVDPYFGQAAEAWFVDFGVPFSYQSGPQKGEVRGIVDFSLEVGDFQALVHAMTLGKTNYGFISSANETLISFPQTEYVGTKNIEDIIAEELDPNLQNAYRAIQNDESGYVQYKDSDTAQDMLFFYDHIPSANWGMGMLFFKRDLTDDISETHRRYIKIALTFSIFLVLIIKLYFSRDILDRREIEQLGLLSIALLLGNIVLIGYLEQSADVDTNKETGAPVIDVSSVSSLINQQNERADTLKVEPLISVPTGVYIERMSFEDSYNVNLGGTIWQKYPLDIADNVEIGVHFPQISPFAESSYIEESYREEVGSVDRENGHLLVQYDFRVTLQLNFSYANYPFDKRHLDIEIAPLNSADRLLLVPDLASYRSTTPGNNSGLNPRIDLSGSEITTSYFSFYPKNYEVDFGQPSQVLQENLPTLTYNIHIKRLLLNPVVKYLIPVLVTLCLIYILILSCTKTNDRQGIIESIAAFFFVLIFSHIDLREKVVTGELIFIEYFYFAGYLMIILSTANLITYAKDKSNIFDFNDNQIFRVCYFPIFLSLVLVVMLGKFY